MPLNVTLISHTPEAENILLFTKSTRLDLRPGLLAEIREWDWPRKEEELAYMANTIPSSWEFVQYIFAIEGVSRAYTHQQVRTRAASYAQQTMRVLDVGDFDFVWPEKIAADSMATSIVTEALWGIKHAYRSLRSLGVAPEDARSILPTNIATNIVCRFDLRTLSELAKSRTGGRTQSEYQKVINKAIDCVLAVHPWAEKFLFQQDRDYFAELEAFALAKFPDLKERGELLKIVDKMRKETK